MAVKWKCSNEHTQTNEFKLPKTAGVRLHKRSDKLQYPALGQAGGNILS